jgi:hypothetical protein
MSFKVEGYVNLSTMARDSVLSPIDCFRFLPAGDANPAAPFSAMVGPGARTCADDVFGT